MRDRLEKWSPPGWDGSGERRAFWILLVFSILYSFQFFGRYWKAYEALFRLDYAAGERVLREGAVMAPFGELAAGSFTGFFILFFLSVLSMGLRYFYYYQGSRSIYLVRRLPKRGFLWESCVVVPLFGIALAFLVMGTLRVVYWECYRILTPAAALWR